MSKECIVLTEQQIEEFSRWLAGRKRTRETVRQYCRILEQLREYLGDACEITPERLTNWHESLRRQSLSESTRNGCTSAVNSFLTFCGRKEWKTPQVNSVPPVPRPELTRVEYLRLLQAARKLHKERVYFLLKVLGGVGLRVGELPCFTVELIRAGDGEIRWQESRRIIHIPEVLRQELLAYAARQGISEGPLFVTRTGHLIDRTNIPSMLKQLCWTAQVAEEKVTPRALWNLYVSTQQEIRRDLEYMARQAYERILCSEQSLIE